MKGRNNFLSMCKCTRLGPGIWSKGMGAPVAKVVTGPKVLKIHKKGQKKVLI